jgi:polygalacturonase
MVMLPRRRLISAAMATAGVNYPLTCRPLVANPPSFAALADGVTDATQALNAAAQDLPNNGVLVLPRGRYRVTRPLLLRSTTTLIGPEATIFCVGDRDSSESHPLVSNVGRNESVIHDHDIAVHDISFEYLGYVTGGSHAIEFRKVNGVRIKACRFSGGDNGTAILACRDTEVSDSVAQGTLNCAFDHWEGSSQCVVRNCMATCAEGYGILFTGVGTDPNDHQQATQLTATDNIVRSPTEAGIWVCSLSEYSSVSNICLSRNRIYGGAKRANGIGATGAIDNFQALGNYIEGVQGGQALFTRPDQWNRPRNVHLSYNRISWCSAAEVALIQALGDDVEVTHNRAIGGHYPKLLWTDGQHVAAEDNF